jgi:hypothetical protein
LLVLRLKTHIYILHLKITIEKYKEKITMKDKGVYGVGSGTYWILVYMGPGVGIIVGGKGKNLAIESQLSN